MILLGPILVLSLAAQAPNPDIQGSVVNSKGEPVAGATVLVYLEFVGQHEPALVSTRTNAHGQFRLAWPRPGGPGRGAVANGNRSRLFAHRRGSALAVGHLSDRTHELVLREPTPRTIAIQQADGKPLAGVKVMPRLIRASSREIAEIPPSLASQFAATTGPDGKATLTSLAAFDEMMAVRVVGDTLAGQDIVLMDRPGRGTGTGPVTLNLQATSQISGRVVDDHGQGVAAQVVEVWTKGNQWLNPCPVEFAKGPVRTVADGSFQTSQTLLAGSIFRVVVRARGRTGSWGTGSRLDSSPANYRRWCSAICDNSRPCGRSRGKTDRRRRGSAKRRRSRADLDQD